MSHKITTEINKMCNSFSLVDGWRIANPHKRKYTWLQGITNKQARLDYILCSDAILSISSSFGIEPKYRSDHSPISFLLQIIPHTQGKGTWKMNNSLLSDPDFISLIKRSINDIKQTYTATPYLPEFINNCNRNLDLMISPCLFWETILVTLRGIIITYASRKKRTQNRERNTLEQNIKLLDDKVNTGIASLEEFNQLAILIYQLILARKNDLNGAYIRSRAEWIEFGEKPSRYFFNLENRNRINKNMSEIKVDENTTLTKQPEILEAMRAFYKNLYTKRENPSHTDLNLILNTTQLTEHEKTSLECLISKEELDRALSQMKNNKSPGMNGFSPEFFKKFRPQLGWFFLDSINERFNKGYLPESQTQGLITCIPKTGKARNLI